MNVAFHNGVSGMIAYQHDLDTLAHNMANVNTTGYKGTRSSFEDLLYTQMDVNTEERQITGHGVRVSGLDLNIAQGTPLSTGFALDFAIVGDGFFAVDTASGTQYTRNGAFDISVEGNKGYLVTMDGDYVLDGKGKNIEVKKIEETGEYDMNTIKETLGVYQFPNNYGLHQTSASRFIQTTTSGEPVAMQQNTKDKRPYQIRSQTLESSNVEVSQEMVDVIVTQRAFQMNAKMVQTGDEVEEIINSLR